MWFVLVVSLVFTGSKGIEIKQFQQEYQNEESCEKAKDWLEKHYPTTVKAKCRQQT